MIEQERVRKLNDADVREGEYVLYWMQQSQRARMNPALEHSIEHADERKLPVVVGFGLMDDYPEANARHYAFMLQGLAEVARELKKRKIAFVMRKGSPDEVALNLAKKAALVVCDRGYLRQPSALARAGGRRGRPRGRAGRGRRRRAGRGRVGRPGGRRTHVATQAAPHVRRLLHAAEGVTTEAGRNATFAAERRRSARSRGDAEESEG